MTSPNLWFAWSLTRRLEALTTPQVHRKYTGNVNSNPGELMKSYPSKQRWTAPQLRRLHRMSANRSTVRDMANALGRTHGAVRQQARRNGLSVGRVQRGVATVRTRHWRAKKLGLE